MIELTRVAGGLAALPNHFKVLNILRSFLCSCSRVVISQQLTCRTKRLASVLSRESQILVAVSVLLFLFHLGFAHWPGLWVGDSVRNYCCLRKRDRVQSGLPLRPVWFCVFHCHGISSAVSEGPQVPGSVLGGWEKGLCSSPSAPAEAAGM